MDAAPSRSDALRAWTAVLARTVVRLGPAVAVVPVRRDAAVALQHRWAREVLARLGIDVTVEDPLGLGHDPRGVLFVHLNQQTLLAPALYGIAFPAARFGVNVEYAALPFVGWASIAMGGVAIVRQRPAQAKAALARVAERLRAGETFGISIEGRRTADGRLSPFKKGPVVLAIEAQCDIVPFMTHGEYDLWPRGEWRIRPGHVDLVVYPPIPTRGLTYVDRERLVAELRTLAERELARRDSSATVRSPASLDRGPETR